jgi:hypothetical protein
MPLKQGIAISTQALWIEYILKAIAGDLVKSSPPLEPLEIPWYDFLELNPRVGILDGRGYST